MTSLREMLARLRPGEELSNDTLVRIETVIEAYNSLDIDSHFRTDVLTAVGSILDLAGTLSQRSYRVDEVFTEISQIQRYLSVLLQYTLVARPKISGFSIFNSTNGAFVPGFYTTKEEAHNTLAQYKAAGISNLEILPTECVAGTLAQPQPLKEIPKPEQKAITEGTSSPGSPVGAIPGGTSPPPVGPGTQPTQAPAPAPNKTPTPSAEIKPTSPGSPGTPKTPPFSPSGAK